MRRAYTCLSKFFGSHQFRWSSKITASPALAAGGPMPGHLSVENQWTRLSDVVAGAVARAQATGHLHKSAGQQIDSATYALQGLLGDLSRVMTLPAPAAAAPVPLRFELPQRAQRRELAA